MNCHHTTLPRDMAHEVDPRRDRGADPNKSPAPWATRLAYPRKRGHAEIETDLRQTGAR